MITKVMPVTSINKYANYSHKEENMNAHQRRLKRREHLKELRKEEAKKDKPQEKK